MVPVAARVGEFAGKRGAACLATWLGGNGRGGDRRGHPAEWAGEADLVIFPSTTAGAALRTTRVGRSLREGKGDDFDGGTREPTIMWWPGTVPAGTESIAAMTIDVLPTVAHPDRRSWPSTNRGRTSGR
jgi:hypothetical protein